MVIDLYAVLHCVIRKSGPKQPQAQLTLPLNKKNIAAKQKETSLTLRKHT